MQRIAALMTMRHAAPFMGKNPSKPAARRNAVMRIEDFTDLLIFWARSRLASTKELIEVVHKFENRSIAQN
jgi:hypothetical protein